VSKKREVTSAAPSSPRPELPVGPRLEAVLEIAHRARRPVLLEGPTGVGKSEVVQGLARRLGIGFTVLDLSLLEPPDLVGLPVIDQGCTTYATPRLLPRDGEGILMLEELNRAERYIQQPALQLLSARRLHEYELPPGWSCFAAINPEIGDYQVTPLDPALRARFLHLPVRADRGAWLAWAVGAGLHPAVLALARTHDRILDDVPPRTWTYVAQLLRVLQPAERASNALLRDLLSGYLPAAWVEALLAQREGWDADLEVDVPRLLFEYRDGCPQQAVVRRYRDCGETDRLNEIARRLLAILQGPEAGVLASRKELTLASFEALLPDLPGDPREQLQEALGANPTLLGLSEVKPEEILKGYGGSAASRKVASWAADPLKHHRIALLVTALRVHLPARADLPELKRSNAPRVSLGQFLAQIGTRWGTPLVETLQRLGLTPIRPGS
jgi:hypothetical protein